MDATDADLTQDFVGSRLRARQGYDWMNNMEPKKPGLTQDDVVFFVAFGMLLLITVASAWLEWMKQELMVLGHL